MASNLKETDVIGDLDQLKLTVTVKNVMVNIIRGDLIFF